MGCSSARQAGLRRLKHPNPRGGRGLQRGGQQEGKQAKAPLAGGGEKCAPQGRIWRGAGWSGAAQANGGAALEGPRRRQAARQYAKRAGPSPPPPPPPSPPPPPPPAHGGGVGVGRAGLAEESGRPWPFGLRARAPPRGIGSAAAPRGANGGEKGAPPGIPRGRKRSNGRDPRQRPTWAAAAAGRCHRCQLLRVPALLLLLLLLRLVVPGRTDPPLAARGRSRHAGHQHRRSKAAAAPGLRARRIFVQAPQ